MSSCVFNFCVINSVCRCMLFSFASLHCEVIFVALQASPEETAHRAGLDFQEYQRRVDVGVTSRQQMIDRNQRLVMHIAKKYLHRGLPMEDLVAEGVQGCVALPINVL